MGKNLKNIFWNECRTFSYEGTANISITIMIENPILDQTCSPLILPKTKSSLSDIPDSVVG